MNRISNAFISSLLSAYIGSIVVAVGMVVAIFFNESQETSISTALLSALIYCSINAIIASILAFVVGSPIYFFLRMLNIANYLSCSVLGVIFIATIYKLPIGPKSVTLYLAGAVTGMVYHYVYTENTAKNI